MDLSQHFCFIATGQNVRIHTLEINNLYQVLFARRLTTTYGPTVELTLKTDGDINAKIFLPKRYAEIMNDDSIEDINNGKKIYKLLYRGKAGYSYILNMEEM